MADGLTLSERFVAQLCERSFLRLWTHPNPIGKKGKELCDCLIVCGPHIIIISVKDNKYRETGDITGWERWIKGAIDKSIDQIAGAERWLQNVDTVTRKDGRVVTLPPHEDRKYHRIAVALGSKGEVPLKWGDTGRGFVHVCDEHSIGVLFSLLDTITDFTNFLVSVESLVRGGVIPICDGGGLEDLVALYLLHGHSFEITDPDTYPDQIILVNGVWKGFHESENFKALQKAYESSYLWDRLIDLYTQDILTEGMFDMHSKEVTNNELALVAMALQPRAYRAVLAEAFKEFLAKPELKIKSRMAQGNEGTAFVFMAGSSADRDARTKELFLRCMVVRGRLDGTRVVIGIATDRPGTSNIGYSSDIVYIDLPNWTEEHERHVTEIQRVLGYFANVQWTKGN